MKKLLSSKGFTLIELLVVITILGILVTLTLVTINPAEAQKKARDTQRLKDMATLQSLVEQYLTDNPGDVLTLAAKGSDVTGTNNCSTGWLSQAIKVSSVNGDFCRYANLVPTDPVNRISSVVDNPTTGATTNAKATYYIAFASSGSSYKICTRLESKANAARLTADGETNTDGNAAKVFAVGSDMSLTCLPQ